MKEGDVLLSAMPCNSIQRNSVQWNIMHSDCSDDLEDVSCACIRACVESDLSVSPSLVVHSPHGF